MHGIETMKPNALLMTCSVIVGLSAGTCSAAMVGSSRAVAQQNFQKLIKTNACPACDLAGVVLTRINLAKANLEGANLAGAKFFMTDLSGANLKNTNLQGAALGGADLAGADLRGANLTGAVLEGAYLKGALLDGRLVEESTEITEEFPDVTEEKYVEDASKGKNVPYTQDAVVPAEEIAPVAAPVEQVPAGNNDKAEIPMGTSIAPPAKTIVPIAEVNIADAGVETQVPSPARVEIEKMAPVEVVSSGLTRKNTRIEQAEEKPGFWGKVTSFFTGDDEVETPAVPKSRETELSQPAESNVQTGKDELPSDSGVLAMIEQIEGPGEQTAQPAVQVVEVVDVSEPAEPSVARSPAASPKALPEIQKEIVAEEPVKESPVAEKPEVVEKIEEAPVALEDNPTDSMATQVTETLEKVTSPVGGMLFSVETPQEAMAKQQVLIDRLLDEERCVGCDLAGVDLSDKNLDEVDLERANLQGANLEDIDLNEANLKGVDFSGANLKGADLREADLYRANFNGADLTGARLEGALVDSANFDGAVGVNLTGSVQEE